MKKNEQGACAPEKDEEATEKGDMPAAAIAAKKDDDEEKTEKSVISEDDLIKSCAALETIAKSGPAARKQELLNKAITGKLEDAEVAELTKALNGTSDTGLTEQVAKAMSGESNEALAKSLDVSDYLDAQHKVLTDSLKSVSHAFEKSEAKRNEETLVLAKALSDVTKASIQTSRMLKSIQEKLGIIAQQPARAPKAAHTQELAKSQAAQLGGGQSDTSRLSPNDVLDTLESMFRKSMEDGNDGITVSGERYEEAISKFEQHHDIHPALLREVVNFRARAGR